jgi:hypothetical protein
MKGILKKTQSGWIVNYDYTVNKNDWCTLPLHRDDISDIMSNPESKVEKLSGKEVEFEMVNKIWGVNDDVITYAKLIKPSIQHSITDYGVEGIDSCLEYKENDVEKLAEKYYGPGDYGLESKQGFIKGYNKAKETLYTEEQVRKAYYKGAADVHDKCTDRTWRGVETKVDIELLKKLNTEYIQSLKQPKQ